MRAALSLILLCLTGVAGAQIYTWRDASGKVHYSDTPPAGVEARKLRAGSAAGTTGTSSAAIGLAEREMEFRKRRMESEKAQAKAEQERREAEEARRNCEEARNQLRALESGQRMSRVDASGERIVLDDEMRAEEIEKARAAVRSWCK